MRDLAHRPGKPARELGAAATSSPNVEDGNLRFNVFKAASPSPVPPSQRAQ